MSDHPAPFLSFRTDKKVTAVVLHQNGRDMRAPRLEGLK